MNNDSEQVTQTDTSWICVKELEVPTAEKNTL